jgi:hypothetical protein
VLQNSFRVLVAVNGRVSKFFATIMVNGFSRARVFVTQLIIPLLHLRASIIFRVALLPKKECRGFFMTAASKSPFSYSGKKYF